MPICVSYLTNTLPIIGGGGVGPASFLPMPRKILGAIQAIFMQMQMLPKIFVKTPAGGCLFYGQINNIQ